MSAYTPQTFTFLECLPSSFPTLPNSYFISQPFLSPETGSMINIPGKRPQTHVVKYGFCCLLRIFVQEKELPTNWKLEAVTSVLILGLTQGYPSTPALPRIILISTGRVGLVFSSKQASIGYYILEKRMDSLKTRRVTMFLWKTKDD